MVEIKIIVDKEILKSAFNAKKAIIFKNSMKCSISAAARKRYEEFAGTCDEGIELYMIDVLANRDLSNEITDITRIVHKSPQVIFLENGEAKESRSHYDITIETLKEAL